MNGDEIVSGLILEFRRGTLIMVVLAQLNKPMYGYSLVKELEGKGISIEGNTCLLYTSRCYTLYQTIYYGNKCSNRC